MVLDGRMMSQIGTGRPGQSVGVPQSYRVFICASFKKCPIHDFLYFRVDVATIEETEFVCEFDARMLSSDYSADRNRLDRCVSLMFKRTFDEMVNLVPIDEEIGWSWPILLWKLVRFGSFRFMRPTARWSVSHFFLQLVLYLVDSSRSVLMGY